MGEAFARIHGAGVVEAYSAGSAPSGTVNTRAIKVMGEIGYDLSRHHSKSADALPYDKFDIVVTMGCGDSCPQIKAVERLEWEIPDPKALPLDEFRAIRDLIEGRVKKLLAGV